LQWSALAAGQGPLAAMFAPRAEASSLFQYVTRSQPQTGSYAPAWNVARFVQTPPVTAQPSTLQYSSGPHPSGSPGRHLAGRAASGTPPDDAPASFVPEEPASSPDEVSPDAEPLVPDGGALVLGVPEGAAPNSSVSFAPLHATAEQTANASAETSEALMTHPLVRGRNIASSPFRVS
jgi:hypothetical protein